jgi:uncharacterized protein (DUF2132 family)
MTQNPYDPLHGVTLKVLVTELVEYFGFERLNQEFNMRCFSHQPSINSALKFLRKTPWARSKVEAFYCQNKQKLSR